MSKYKKELVHAVAEALVSYGYNVYLAAKGEHGFYTDGNSVVCFGGPWELCLNFSGNYDAGGNAKYIGTGWQIAADVGVPTKEEADRYINQKAPNWATRGLAVKHVSPQVHLNTYGKSSGYEKFKTTVNKN